MGKKKQTNKILIFIIIILSLALTYKIIIGANKLIIDFQAQCPEFSFQNNTLIVEGENKKIVKGDETGYYGVIVDSQKENISDIEEAGDYQRLVAILKDKITIKSADGMESSVTYEEINQNYDLTNFNKETLLQVFSSNNMIKLYAIFAVTAFVYLYIIYLIQILLDTLLLSVVGYLISKIVNVKLKYKSIFNMSAYALTLSIILYLIYIIINIYTGFTIKYFEIAYNAIAYIYIITAMMIIKSDLIKQQMEVGRIVEEQKKIRENNQEQEEQEEKKEEDKQKDKNKKEKKEKNPENGTPEGNEA